MLVIFKVCQKGSEGPRHNDSFWVFPTSFRKILCSYTGFLPRLSGLNKRFNGRPKMILQKTHWQVFLRVTDLTSTTFDG
ncbi:hypothetical protein RO3G_06339 [Rhizopus delemar RA 99-880]|uniref:Uncharacterized protein n=1 Tax=Rhizopus delemar (strain RA 99-880 / ATCC MYA-4621 / FGSC 9543 / NRRL 43880) TaxID=246409 RepID=I1BZK4_RHIO9|nr:hypothetical protein RO3G_06339 [Rhizopus delemar RA 99-880]|eukprot:EIE81634.1 hypothetical protein RO3G_06339 [Rhizopus delemar RA 99-880]